jgi:hypothetical protein
VANSTEWLVSTHVEFPHSVTVFPVTHPAYAICEVGCPSLNNMLTINSFSCTRNRFSCWCTITSSLWKPKDKASGIFSHSHSFQRLCFFLSFVAYSFPSFFQTFIWVSHRIPLFNFDCSPLLLTCSHMPDTKFLYLFLSTVSFLASRCKDSRLLHGNKQAHFRLSFHLIGKWKKRWAYVTMNE